MNCKNKIALICLLAAMLAMGGCTDIAQEGIGGGSSSSSQSDSSGKSEEVVKPMEDENVPSVDFSLESGFYDDDIQLELSSEGSGAVIRYTTDGSIPTSDSAEYTGAITLTDRKTDFAVLAEHTDISANGDYKAPMNVTKGNVIRAAAFYPDGTVSATVSHTYFVGIDRASKYGNVPVISIMIDQKDLFDYDTGIYTLGKRHDEWLEEDKNNKNLDGWRHEANYSLRGREWEKPIFAEYIAPDGTVGFGQDMGVRIMGAASRNEYQKSLRLLAREDYGKKNVKYEIIPDNERSDGQGNVEKYKSFVLRNGGNDCNFAKIRDPFLQSMVADKPFETMQFTPVVVFLDGEYWGMYTLAEDYSDNYIENNYGIDNKDVVLIKRGEIEEGDNEDIELYNDMYDFITGNDMSDPDNYAKACDMLDMQSFSDYLAFNIYIANEDSFFQNNNWRMWRVRTADGATEVSDGKWRMMAYDTDYSSGIYSGGQNYDDNFIKKAINGNRSSNERAPADMFRCLLDNEDFKQMFILSLCDMRNISFEKEKVGAALDEMVDVYSPLVKDTYSRFGPQYAKDGFDYNIDGFRQFLNGRYDVFLTHITDSFKPGGRAEVVVKTDDASKGGAILNSTRLDLSEKDFSGKYYTAYPITLTADPSSGTFVRWEATGCTLSDPNAETVTVTIDGDCEITAIYE